MYRCDACMWFETCAYVCVCVFEFNGLSVLKA